MAFGHLARHGGLPVYCVIFEVQPEPAQMDTYLALAARLKPEVERNEGFLSVERFKSRARPGWVLSLQFWRDDEAVARWRRHEMHRGMQERGRRDLFLDYRLRVGPVLQTAAPARAPARTVAVIETDAERAELAPRLADQDVFDSLYNQGRCVLLGAWPDTGAATGWRERTEAAIGPTGRLSIVAVARDYTKTSRSEAPR